MAVPDQATERHHALLRPGWLGKFSLRYRLLCGLLPLSPGRTADEPPFGLALALESTLTPVSCPRDRLSDLLDDSAFSAVSTATSN